MLTKIRIYLKRGEIIVTPNGQELIVNGVAPEPKLNCLIQLEGGSWLRTTDNLRRRDPDDQLRPITEPPPKVYLQPGNKVFIILGACGLGAQSVAVEIKILPENPILGNEFIDTEDQRWTIDANGMQREDPDGKMRAVTEPPPSFN